MKKRSAWRYGRNLFLFWLAISFIGASIVLLSLSFLGGAELFAP